MKRAAVALLIVATLAIGVVASGSATAYMLAANGTAADNTTEQPSFGTSVSAFMAASAVDANATVDQEMWEASMNGSANATAATTTRVNALQQRLDRLADRRQALLAAYRNGSIPEVAFRAQMAALAAHYRQIAAAANSTAEMAHAHNVTPPGLQGLVANASEAAKRVAGPPGDVPGMPDVAANRTTGPPENHTTGPPANRTTGPPGDGPAGPTDNRTTGPPANRTTETPNGGPTGPSENRTTGPSDDRTAGAPDDSRTGTTENRTSNGKDHRGTSTNGSDGTTTGPNDSANGPNDTNHGGSLDSGTGGSATTDSVRADRPWGVTLLNARP